jgi:hypothetical protein
VLINPIFEYSRIRCKSGQNELIFVRNQQYATHPLFLDNLHFEHFVKSVNLKRRFNYLMKSSKWRLSKKGDESAELFGLRLLEKVLKTTLKCFSVFENLRLGSIKLLQKIIASQKINTSHATNNSLISFVIILQSFTDDMRASRPFCNRFW